MEFHPFIAAVLRLFESFRLGVSNAWVQVAKWPAAAILVLTGERWARPRSQDLGSRGERVAERFLRKSGYKILMRNYVPRRGGEVDLVCRVRGRRELVFVEVKTRSSEEFGAPQHAVNWRKRQRLIQAANEWLELLDKPDVTARFDIVEVLSVGARWEVRHLVDAFFAAETLHAGGVPLIPGANRGDVLPKHGYVGGARSHPRRVRD
jgi:putative endonuclease